MLKPSNRVNSNKHNIMTTFDLELRIKTFGSIITWKVFLEDSTNDNNKVLDWLQAEDYRFKQFPDYKISDNSLEVFASCHGISGGLINVEVLINDQSQKDKVVSRVEEKEYAKQSYPIK